MSFALIKMPGESIVLLRARLEELVAGDDLASVSVQLQRIAAVEGRPPTLIWDLSRQEIMIYAIHLLIYEVEALLAGVMVDPRYVLLLVGDHPLIPVLQRKVSDALGLRMGQFPTIDDALRWSRQQLA